jgi:hypothetical protein
MNPKTAIKAVAGGGANPDQEPGTYSFVRIPLSKTWVGRPKKRTKEWGQRNKTPQPILESDTEAPRKSAIQVEMV